MSIETKIDFLIILHLAEAYQKQYVEMNLCLSQEQNEASFRDFVQQYYAAVHGKRRPAPIIHPDVLLF